MLPQTPVEFRSIEDLPAYAERLLAAQGRRLYAKHASVRARPGVPGERLETVLRSGLRETANTVRTDAETGRPDWIVTADSGEEYLLGDSAFRAKYAPDPASPGRYLPAGKPVPAVRLPENVRFRAPWGELESVLAGGYLVIAAPDNIYGVAEEEFLNTYRPVQD